MEMPNVPTQPRPDLDGWKNWPETQKALSQTYYQKGLAPMDSAYALAGLQRYLQTWHATHQQHEIPQWILDQAAASEVFYHWTRARHFGRPVAALSACWTSLVIERPERVIDRKTRADKAFAGRQARDRANALRSTRYTS